MWLKLFTISGICLLFSACKLPYNKSDVYDQKANLSIDEAVHVKNSLEWWYFTGHLKDSVKNKELGIEYVVFHFNPTNIKGGWMINMAVTDPEEKKFYYDHRYFSKKKNDFVGLPLEFNWEKKQFKSSLSGKGGNYEFKADNGFFSYELETSPAKDVVLHDEVGYENYGNISRAGYFSFPRLNTNGVISLDNERYEVKGQLWYDRQWNCSGVFNKEIAWDWFSIQFEETNSELMVYKLYKKDGSITILGGTYTDANNQSIFLESEDIALQENEFWKSPVSGYDYPIKWNIKVDKLKLETNVWALIPNQELELNTGPFTSFFYWEGMCRAKGSVGNQKVSGKSYVEMNNRKKSKKNG